jgi:alkylation response protein AidB-like acyl-CoA dehydrogenase
MNLDLSETQSLLQETVRSYLTSEVPYDRIRTLEKEGGSDDVLWKAMVEQGWLGLSFSEARGGGGGALVDVGLVVEEIARRAAIVPILEVVAVGRVLESHCKREGEGDGESRAIDELVGSVLRGDAVPVPAIFEGGGCGGDVELVCVSGTLTGSKSFVDYGAVATHHLVAAREEGGGDLGLYLVDARGSGVSTEPLRSIGRTPLCHVGYDGVAARRLAGAEACAELVRLGRALASVQCVGAMQQALDMTVAYANVREQFGKTISTFQAVRHHCANMAIRVASARGLAYEALDAIDRGVATDAQVAAAKASASRAAPEVTMLAHQIHGGNGVIEENDLYFYTLRAKEQSLAWGSFDECMAAIADQVHVDADWF